MVTGATGVLVGTQTFNVDFVDGSCSDIYDGCDAATDFTFDLTSAQLAGEALVADVFRNTATLNLATDPELMFGCTTNPSLCQVLIPYGLHGFRGVDFVLAQNGNEVSFPDLVRLSATSSVFDTSGSSGAVYTIWTPAGNPVLESATGILVATGLPGLAGYQWSQRQREGRRVG